MRYLTLVFSMEEKKGGEIYLYATGQVATKVDAIERQDQLDNALRSGEQLIRAMFRKIWDKEDRHGKAEPADPADGIGGFR